MSILMDMPKSAAASDRLIVPISPSEKRAVARKAAAEKLSMAEFVRRAILRYDSRSEASNEEAELKALLEVFKQVHAETLQQLDRTDAALDAVLARFDDRKKRAA